MQDETSCPALYDTINNRQKDASKLENDNLDHDDEKSPLKGKNDQKNTLTYVDESQNTDKTTIWKSLSILVLYSIPNIVSGVCEMIIITINLHYISKSGNETWIAGLGLGHTFLNTIIYLPLVCFNLGTIIISAPAFGAQNYRLVGLYYHRALILKVFLLILSSILVLFSYRIFKAIGAEEDIAYQAYIYCIYSLPAMIVATIYITTINFFATNQLYAAALVINLIMPSLHWVWCKLFIEYLGLGVKGASYSVAASLGLGGFMCFCFMCSSKHFKKTLFWFKKESFHSLLRQFKLEAFASAPFYLETVALEIYTLVSATFGTLDLSAWVIFYNIICLIYMVPQGIGLTISQLIGNSIGERDLHKTKSYIKASIYLAVLIAASGVVLLYLCRKPFVGVYSTADDIYETAIPLVLTYLIIMPVDMLQIAVISILKGIGKEKITTLIFILCYYFMGFVVAYILGVVKHMEGKGLLNGFGVGCYSLLILSAVKLYRTDISKQSEEIYQQRAAS